MSDIILNDVEISKLVQEQKVFPHDYEKNFLSGGK